MFLIIVIIIWEKDNRKKFTNLKLANKAQIFHTKEYDLINRRLFWFTFD